MSTTETPEGMIEVEIPFMGFYESIHDENVTEAVCEAFSGCDDEDGLPEDAFDLLWQEAEIPWRDLHNEYAKAFVEALSAEINVPLEYVTMQSPKEYNFSTNRIFANMPIERWKDIRTEVEDYNNWSEVIRERFTNRSGFISFFSNDSTDEEWTREDLEPVQTRIYLEQYLLGNLGGNWEYQLEVHANELKSIGKVPTYDKVKADHEAKK